MSGRRVGPGPDRPPVQSAWMARWAGGPRCSSSAGGEASEGRVIEFMGERSGLGQLGSGKFGTWSGGIGDNGDAREEMLSPVLALAPPGSGEREIDRPSGSSSRRGGGGFQRMLSHPGVRFVPRESGGSMEGRGLSEDLYGRSRVLPRMPLSARDTETMRIYTKIDTVAGSAIGPQRFSQTTHHFFITKKSDVDVARGDEMFRQSTVSSEEKAAREFITLPSDITLPGRKGLTLKSLDGSTESEKKGKVDTFKSSAVGSRNESSAETDTMDMDALRVNNRSGTGSPSLNEVGVEDEQTRQISHSLGTSLREKSQGRMLTTELPDINKPAVSGVAAEAGDCEASTSRTQSLDVDCFVPNAKSFMKRSGSDPDGALESDPCSRWVKRLKPSSSNAFTYGTKISVMEETSLHRKVNKFKKILGCSQSSSELVDNKFVDREMTMMNQTGASAGKSNSQSSSSAKESQEVTLSHAWIQRWCHNSDALSCKKHGSLIFSEQQGSRAADYEEKQFPSIAAMALMGKAVNGFPPCELRKRGSLSVWNTEGY